MKKIVLILLIIQLIPEIGNSQYYNSSLFNGPDGTSNYKDADSTNSFFESYGFEINGFNTNSGFKGGYEIAIYAKSLNKTMEIGAYLDKKMFSLSGLSIAHKLFILQNKSINYLNIKPFLFYNLIYRVTTLDSMSVSDSRMSMMLGSSKTRYASLEHYLGIGSELRLYHSIYLNANFGFGRYYGSIKKEIPTATNSVFNMGSNGWSGFVKIGIGYTLP